MNVLTDKELRGRWVSAFFAGALLGISAGALLDQYVNTPAATAGAPQIMLQAPSQTVARIPTKRAGELVYCTVTIDQTKNIWSIVC